jgi:hypothetical protein
MQTVLNTSAPTFVGQTGYYLGLTSLTRFGVTESLDLTRSNLPEGWAYMDRDVALLEPTGMARRHKIGQVSVYKNNLNGDRPEGRLTHPQMAALVLGLPFDTPRPLLKALLLVHGHCFYINGVVQVTNREDFYKSVGCDGRCNFFFVTGTGGDVLVLEAMKDGGEWYGHLFPFDIGNPAREYGWGYTDTLVVRNCYHKKLFRIA